MKEIVLLIWEVGRCIVNLSHLRDNGITKICRADLQGFPRRLPSVSTHFFEICDQFGTINTALISKQKMDARVDVHTYALIYIYTYTYI